MLDFFCIIFWVCTIAIMMSLTFVGVIAFIRIGIDMWRNN